METFRENEGLANEKIWAMMQEDRLAAAVQPDISPGKGDCQIKC